MQTIYSTVNKERKMPRHHQPYEQFYIKTVKNEALLNKYFNKQTFNYVTKN